MADHSRFPAGEQRGLLPRPRGQSQVPNCVDASKERMEVAGFDEVPNSRRSDSGRQQLWTVDDALLPRPKACTDRRCNNVTRLHHERSIVTLWSLYDTNVTLLRPGRSWVTFASGTRTGRSRKRFHFC